MKTKIILALFSLLVLPGLYGCWTAQDGTYTQTRTVATTSNNVYTDYNADDLNSYGEWINVPEYGRVWRPYANQNWQPFTDGHWVYDGRDWVWASYEPYGAIVYHYGNWEYVGNHQWVWIPNNSPWSPACVDWVYYGNQVAWAPRPHSGHSYGNPWDHYDHPVWVVVHNGDFYNDHVGANRLPVDYRDNVKYRDDQIVRRAPDVKYIEQSTQRSVPVSRDIIRNGKIDTTPATRHPSPVERNPNSNSNGQTPTRIDNSNERPLPVVKDPKQTPAPVKVDNGTRTPAPAVKTPEPQQNQNIDRESGNRAPLPTAKPTKVKPPAASTVAPSPNTDAVKQSKGTPAVRTPRAATNTTKVKKPVPVKTKAAPAEQKQPEPEKKKADTEKRQESR